ncbi:BamA/TamA family outer membrane protein [Hymenobacter sp. BT188]|uniref:BamA/TamA family outer membrane protein n=1 Tax=Hymenobacter sp. BT188 TaxID=2763504 RepID=UPI0016515CE5|nr:BamA/TamA family outer membrane protein [Hymenobacter sp. BT188]
MSLLACLLSLLLGSSILPSRLVPDSLKRAPTDSLLQTQCPQYAVVRVGTILFAGNEVTKEVVLRAELDFHEGDTLDAATLAARLENNRLRLFNLRLFHSVIQQTVCRNGEITVLFAVQERWYTFPIPTLSFAERNFNAWLDRPDRLRRVNYGLYIVRKNFRGRNEEVRANVQLGFNRRYELFYEAPGYGPRRRIGFGAGISYTRSRALDYATIRDRLVTFRPEDGLPLMRQYGSLGLRWRQSVQRFSALDVAYYKEQVSDSVVELNPVYFLNGPRREYLELKLTSTLNQRNTFAYPLTGRFAQVVLSHRIFLTSGNANFTTLVGRYSQYFALGGNFYYNFNLQSQLRFAQRIGYADNRALGYDSHVRGYDAYVIDGRHYGLARQSVSYRLLDAGKIKLQGITNSKINSLPLVIYLNTFTDAGYVLARTTFPENRLPNQLLGAAGVGLHFVTYYDRVLTVEYTRNGRGEGGFFLRSDFPI